MAVPWVVISPVCFSVAQTQVVLGTDEGSRYRSRVVAAEHHSGERTAGHGELSADEEDHEQHLPVPAGAC